MKPVMATVLLVLLSLFIHSNAKEKAFDVRQHLSIVSRYSVVEDIANSSFVPSTIPDGCTLIHLNLVARHENRSPTKKWIKELDNLAAHLEVLLREAEEQNLSLEKLPGWLKGWKSPWKGKLKGGELIIQGEDELYDLGIRTRARFPNLFNDDYHPDIYAIKATQVPRASASAVAFGMGLFSGKGSLGPGRHRAFAVPNESRASDTMLRFHDCCQNYKWTNDLEAFILKGYGKSIHYRMGVPLLEDVVQSMEQAIKAEEEKYAPGSYEKARLRFAHAETMVPFSCLLGLFLDGSEFQKIQREQSLQLLPKPPQKRN